MVSSPSVGFPKIWVVLSRLISFLFHPLLVGLFMAWFLIYVTPGYYQYLDPKAKTLTLATIIVSNFLLPVVIVLLLKGLGFIDSIFLRTQKERIAPYMATIILFFWSWYVFYNRYSAPQNLRDTLQGMFYASIAASMFNIYFKISMHAIGMGGLVGMMVVLLFQGSLIGILPLALAVLAAGIVISARLITGDHLPGDMLSGFLVGLGSQLLAHLLI
jgi:hypothetical protein